MAVMGFFGFIFVYGLRVNLSVAIVCMVKKDNTTGNTSTNVSSCGADDSNTSYSKNVSLFSDACNSKLETNKIYSFNSSASFEI